MALRDPQRLCRATMVLSAAFALAGCSGDPLAVVLDFPDDTSFLKSDSAWIGLYDDVTCAEALDADYAGTEPLQSSGTVPLCDLWNDPAATRLEGVEEDRFVIVALVRGGPTDLVYLQGCQPYRGTQPVEIPLIMTNAFVDDTSDPQCPDVSSRCGGSCP